MITGTVPCDLPHVDNCMTSQCLFKQLHQIGYKAYCYVKLTSCSLQTVV